MTQSYASWPITNDHIDPARNGLKVKSQWDELRDRRHSPHGRNAVGGSGRSPSGAVPPKSGNRPNPVGWMLSKMMKGGR